MTLDTPDRCDQVLIALRRIVRAIDLHSHQLIQQHGVTGPQVLLLRNVARLEPVSVGDLARQVSLSQATVTDILDRLERRGLVQRVRSETDKRRVLIHATADGAALLRRAPPLLQEGFVTAFRELPERDQASMLASLQRVATMMDARDLDAAPLLSSGPLIGNAPHLPGPHTTDR